MSFVLVDVNDVVKGKLSIVREAIKDGLVCSCVKCGADKVLINIVAIDATVFLEHVLLCAVLCGDCKDIVSGISPGAVLGTKLQCLVEGKHCVGSASEWV